MDGKKMQIKIEELQRRIAELPVGYSLKRSFMEKTVFTISGQRMAG